EHRVHHLCREPAHREGRGSPDAAPHDRSQEREGHQAQRALGHGLERAAVGHGWRDPDQPLQVSGGVRGAGACGACPSAHLTHRDGALAFGAIGGGGITRTIDGAARASVRYSGELASSTGGTSGGTIVGPCSKTISSPAASTNTVSPARNSLWRIFSDKGSSTSRWIVRRSGRAPSAWS